MLTTDISKAKEALENDDLIAIPTETVYGLAGNAFSDTAVKKIFDLKQRPHYNPLIVHISSIDFLSKVARDIPPLALTLAQHFWPGPLTLVLKKQAIVPDMVTAGKDTVAVRMPDHALTLALLKELDFPLAAPSANPFGCISPSTAQHVYNYFHDTLPVILDGGPCQKGIESTIIGFENDEPILYRHGSLAIEDIEALIGPVKTKTLNNANPQAPGMLSKHYAPKTRTYLTEDISKSLKEFEGKRIGVMMFKDKAIGKDIVHQEVLSINGDMKEAARNLYKAMHILDQQELDVIIVEKFPDINLGITINDRLNRATKL
ncbi:L-threonylcarbamoyladenylate synthase [Pedobacter glucosidilyticus]|uniref:L-threonylcarbamoyladenylate synthase n=1 Tax=Pedobacter glucosidilyticus TaxID=1122941 RepID=UPI0026F03853|nr:L-threonylcarbamoyladenylate synthase [Pedobacter glucosidilyticus]